MTRSEKAWSCTLSFLIQALAGKCINGRQALGRNPGEFRNPGEGDGKTAPGHSTQGALAHLAPCPAWPGFPEIGFGCPPFGPTGLFALESHFLAVPADGNECNTARPTESRPEYLRCLS